MFADYLLIKKKVPVPKIKKLSYGVCNRFTDARSARSHWYCLEVFRQSCSDDIIMICTGPSLNEYQNTPFDPDTDL